MAQPMLAAFGISGAELVLVLAALSLIGLFLVAVAVVAFLVIRSLNRKSAPPPAISQTEGAAPSGKEAVQDQNLAGSQFHHVNLAGAEFDNVNLTSAKFHNVNLSNVNVTAAQMGGTTFKHIGPPRGADGKQERQRPVRFEEMMLCDSVFQKVDLSNVRVTDCALTGMTIDGVLVTDLIAAYERQQAG